MQNASRGNPSGSYLTKNANWYLGLYCYSSTASILRTGKPEDVFVKRAERCALKAVGLGRAVALLGRCGWFALKLFAYQAHQVVDLFRLEAIFEGGHAVAADADLLG